MNLLISTLGGLQGLTPLRIPLMLVWVTFPFLIGFSIYLLPKISRVLALSVAIVSGGYALLQFGGLEPLTVELLDHFGVTLTVDTLGAYFILTNALVTIAVLSYCWSTGKSAFFYTQLILLHGSVNAVFICSDFISLYVALEVISIAAFLLISYPRSDRSIWVALRYLFVSNTGMLFYLIGAALVYQHNQSFAFAGIETAPPEAIALIFVGLLTKGGIFASGLWLPLTHSEAETPISAMLSGVVVKAGVLPLLRFALISPDLDPIVRTLGIATALMGVTCAIFSKDTKRMLAFHTVSQLGFVLAAPAVGGFYALTHGLVKAGLFLLAGNLPSRSFKDLKKHPIATNLWIPLTIASFSIAGLPLLAGFGAKALTLKYLLPWQVWGMNLAALGTAISFAKFIFLPHRGQSQKTPTFWLAITILLGGLVFTNGFYLEAYTLSSMIKSLITIALGWLTYFIIIRRIPIQLSNFNAFEYFEHLIGGMSLVLTVLFWMVLV
ncbi:MAG: cation:proton antiporter [Prochlorotrichaceae cyanobacterium]